MACKCLHGPGMLRRLHLASRHRRAESGKGPSTHGSCIPGLAQSTSARTLCVGPASWAVVGRVARPGCHRMHDNARNGVVPREAAHSGNTALDVRTAYMPTPRGNDAQDIDSRSLVGARGSGTHAPYRNGSSETLRYSVADWFAR